MHTAQNADIWISLNIYDTLLAADARTGKGVAAGRSPRRGRVPTTARRVTLKLRPEPQIRRRLAARPSDVNWSLDRAATKETGGEFRFLLASIACVDVEGDDTVVLHLAHPDPALLQALATFNAGIMPEKLVMAAPGADLEEKSKNFADHPVGSGPFTAAELEAQQRDGARPQPVLLEAGADGKPLPYLDTIRFLIIPDDATRILKLKAGEVDIAEFVPYSRVAELKADPKLNMVLFPAAQVNYFTLNTRPTLKDGTKNPLNDVRVRQALNYATDKEALIQVVSYGAGTPPQQLHADVHAAAVRPGPLYPYDLAQGEEAAEGCRLRRAASKSPAWRSPAAPTTPAKLSALQQMWAQLGVKLKIEQLEAATRLARYNASAISRCAPRSGPTTSTTRPRSPRSSPTTRPARATRTRLGGQAPTTSCSSRARSELDPAKRAAEYKEIQERYAAAAPIIFAMEVPYPVAMLKIGA